MEDRAGADRGQGKGQGIPREAHPKALAEKGRTGVPAKAGTHPWGERSTHRWTRLPPGRHFLPWRYRLRDAVLLEPGEHARPCVLRIGGVVARPVIGIEAVLSVGIDLALAGLAGRLARRLPLLDQFWRDAFVLAAIEGQYRAFQIDNDIGRVLRPQLVRLLVDAVP